MEGEIDYAAAGDAVITTRDELDIGRGDLLAADNARPVVAEQFVAHIIWMSEQAMLPGRSYFVAAGTTLVRGQITELKFKINVDTFEHLAAKHLDLNDIGFCNVGLDRPIAFDPYRENREMGGFILIDPSSNATVRDDCVSLAPCDQYSLAGP
jgi:bifunctional enzyme CysN/CysC